MSQTFNKIYGTEVDDLISWQKLCAVLQIHPMPGGLKACQDVSMTIGAFKIQLNGLLNENGLAGCPLGTRQYCRLR